MFDDAEIGLLRSLRETPVWHTLLAKLTPDPIKPWRRDLAEKTEKQYEAFIYESGFADGANDVLTKLKVG